VCLGIPGELVDTVEEQPDLAVVRVGGVRRKINVALLADQDLRLGDWVLVHVGFALSKISEDEARAVLSFLATLGTPYDDELTALRESNIG
jgi:hydrogenase expression/formation protein HypC